MTIIACALSWLGGTVLGTALMGRMTYGAMPRWREGYFIAGMTAACVVALLVGWAR